MRIAIIDSGIHEGHPHVGRVAASVHITATGLSGDPVDHLGHGTAVAGAIREKAPEADLFSVKVFDRRLSANIGVILRALAWCREQRMDLVNLSLGTEIRNTVHRYSRPWQATRLSLARRRCCRGASLASSALPRIQAAPATSSGIAGERISHRPIRGPSPVSRNRGTCRESASRSRT